MLFKITLKHRKKTTAENQWPALILHQKMLGINFVIRAHFLRSWSEILYFRQFYIFYSFLPRQVQQRYLSLERNKSEQISHQCTLGP